MLHNSYTEMSRRRRSSVEPSSVSSQGILNNPALILGMLGFDPWHLAYKVRHGQVSVHNLVGRELPAASHVAGEEAGHALAVLGPNQKWCRSNCDAGSFHNALGTLSNDCGNRLRKTAATPAPHEPAQLHAWPRMRRTRAKEVASTPMLGGNRAQTKCVYFSWQSQCGLPPADRCCTPLTPKPASEPAGAVDGGFSASAMA